MTTLLLTLLTYGASQEPHYFAQFWQYRVEVSVASLKEPCNESFKLISADVPYRNERALQTSQQDSCCTVHHAVTWECFLTTRDITMHRAFYTCFRKQMVF